MKAAFLLILTVVLLAAWLPASGQVPSSAPEQPWPPDLTSLIERPFGGGGGSPPVSYVEPAGQVGGITDAVFVQGNLAYVGDGPRLVILDVTDPPMPVPLGQTEPLPDLVKGVTVAGGLAYVAAGEAGLYIFNVADPAVPSPLSAYDTPSATHRVALSGTTAFLAATASGLQILDVSDPTQPQLLGSLDTPGSATGVVVTGDLAYISDLESGLRIADVSDPALPVDIGGLDTPGYAWGVDVAGTTAYIADEIGGLRLIDVSDPTHPVEVGAYIVPTNAVGVTVSGTTAYLADWWSGLRIVDVSDPAAPTQLGVYDTPGFASQVALQAPPAGLSWTITAYVADGDGGLRIVDVTQPASPAELGSYNTLGSASNVAVVGSLAYVAGVFSGLRIMDATAPGQPTEIGRYPVPSGCADVAVVGNTAYLATLYRGLLTLDVRDPSAPALLGSLSLPDGSRSVAVLDTMAYLASVDGGLRIVDVTNPTNPIEVGAYPVPGEARAVAVRGSIAYMAAGPAGLAVIDVSNPRRPSLIAVLDTPGDAWDITLAGALAFIADRDGGVRVIDITDPRHPQEYSPIRVPGAATGVDVGMKTPNVWPRVVYVAMGGDGLAVVDHALPSQPITASYDTPGDAVAVTVTGSMAYVADGAGGLNVLRLLRDRQEMTITTEGGSLAAADASLVALFPAGAFSETVTVTYERLAADENTGQRLGIGQTYQLRATSAATGQPAALVPDKSYAVVARYTDPERGPIIEESLDLRFWEGGHWLAEPTSQVHQQANAVTALPQRLGWWAVLGDTHRTYLPLASRGGPSAVPCQGQGNIVLWHGWSGREADALGQILTNWAEDCPSIQVDAQFVEQGELRNRFIAAATAGGGPDFLFGHGDWIGELAEAGLLRSLENFPVYVGSYFPAAVEASRFRGLLYGIPVSIETVAMLYNKELVAAPPTTLDGLLAAAANQGGLAMNYGFYHAFWGIPAHGGALFDENETCILDQGGFAEWLDWLAAHQHDPGVNLSTDYAQLLNRFRRGAASLYPDGPWAVASLAPTLGDKLGVAPLPAGPVGPAGPFLGARAVLFSSVPNEHQTWLALQFSRYLTSVESQQILMDWAGRIPANASVVPSSPLAAGFMAQAGTAYPLPNTPRMSAVWAPGQAAYEKVLQGIMSGQEAAVEACAIINGTAAPPFDPSGS